MNNVILKKGLVIVNVLLYLTFFLYWIVIIISGIQTEVSGSEYIVNYGANIGSVISILLLLKIIFKARFEMLCYTDAGIKIRKNESWHRIHDIIMASLIVILSVIVILASARVISLCYSQELREEGKIIKLVISGEKLSAAIAGIIQGMILPVVLCWIAKGEIYEKDSESISKEKYGTC